MHNDLRSAGWKSTDLPLRAVVKELTPYLKDSGIQHFRNLFYIAEQNLSLAHCLQHNHIMHLAVPGYDYSSIIGCYGSYKAIDTVKLDGQILSGSKGWLTNLFDSDVVVLQAPISTGQRYHIAIELSSTPHILSHTHPGSIGMIGASPGMLIFPAPIELNQNQILNEVGSPEAFITANYANYSFITNHVGLIIGLYQQLLSYKKTQDPELTYRCKMLELDIAALKMAWEDNLPTTAITSSSDKFWNNRNTQFAQCKKVLLNLIQFVLEMGIHDFIDNSSDTSTRFRDALTFVTHMTSLHKCHKELYYTRF